MKDPIPIRQSSKAAGDLTESGRTIVVREGFVPGQVKLRWCPDCSRTAARDCANGNTCGVIQEYWNGSGTGNKKMWMQLGLSFKLRRPFSRVGSWRQFTASSKQVAMKRWGCWEEAVRSQSWQEQLLELQWHCKTLSSLCPSSPAIMITCLLQLPYQATSFALARALFSSFSFCFINLQLLPYFFHTNDALLVKIYSLDHSSPSLLSLWSFCSPLCKSSTVLFPKLLLFNLWLLWGKALSPGFCSTSHLRRAMWVECGGKKLLSFVENTLLAIWCNKQNLIFFFTYMQSFTSPGTKKHIYSNSTHYFLIVVNSSLKTPIDATK